jgi:cytochrome c biogenesis protein CcmG/thiol:disulfide interchange protein DsbE
MRARFARKLAFIAGTCLLVGGFVACGSEGEEGGSQTAAASDRAAERSLARAPKPLAALYEQRNELLSGGTAAFEERLRELRGFPIVVNKWASWCGPCRAEFPFFQSQAAKLGDEVAFVGIDFFDSNDAARTFLDANPVPYPSYLDPDKEIAASLDVEGETPATVFFNSKGEQVYAYRGGYASEQDLAADIERYAR